VVASALLLREARAAAQLRGEHVVRVYDVGELESGTPFIVMERLEGCDLADIARDVGPMPIPIAVALVVQAARAVSEAHAAGIVHRDLKPSNLFVVRQPGGKALLKVVDFGISKSLRLDQPETQTLTGARIALGSPHYMSPEQVRDARGVDARTDIWALGVILYELIAGRPAFQADTYPGIFAAIAADVPPSLSSLRPEVATGLERIIERCLERNLPLRFQRASELARELEPYAARELDYDEISGRGQVLAPADVLVTGARPSLPRDARPAYEQPTSLNAPRANAATPPPHEETPRVASSDKRASDNTHTQLSRDIDPVVHSQDAGALQSTSQRGSSKRTQRSPSEIPGASATGLGRRLAVALLVLSGFAGLIVLLTRRPPASTVSSASTPTTLSIETEPAGARVTEGGKDYGVTPLRLVLPRSAASAPARAFMLTLPGYRPHVVEPTAGGESTTVRVELVRETPSARAALEGPANASASPSASVVAPPASVAPAPSAAHASPVPVPTRHARPATGRPPSAASASAVPDIRLVR
jgi:serine/threonine-protein kinase